MAAQNKPDIQKIYKALFEHFGPQYWWPAQTKFEIIVGAILTQNTNWGNVKKAINNLKKAKLLNPHRLLKIPPKQLAALIKPAGYFNVKTKRLKNFIHFMFEEYQGSIKRMAKEDTLVLRRKLVAVNGVGEETADSILLYVFNRPVFVVDAYTKRIFYRHNFVAKDSPYPHVQELFEDALVSNENYYNEYHALIVNLGKNFCKPNPHCEACPINNISYSLIKKCTKCHKYLPDSNKTVCRDCR